MALILMVSSSSAEVELFKEAMRDVHLAVDVAVMDDCHDAHQFLRIRATREGVPPPDMIVMDVPFPTDGYPELIEYMDNSPMFKDVHRIALMQDEGMIKFSEHQASMRRVFAKRPVKWDDYVELMKHIRSLLDEER